MKFQNPKSIIAADTRGVQVSGIKLYTTIPTYFCLTNNLIFLCAIHCRKHAMLSNDQHY